jgi:ankyrin repeat protein
MSIFSQGLKRHDSVEPPARRDEADTLAMAIIARLPKVVTDGVKRGVDVNRIGQAGIPPLNLATAMNQSQIAEILLDGGALPDVPAGEHAMTPLHHAVSH